MRRYRLYDTSRGLVTLLAAGVAGLLLWVATLVGVQSTTRFWESMGIVAAGGGVPRAAPRDRGAPARRPAGAGASGDDGLIAATPARRACPGAPRPPRRGGGLRRGGERRARSPRARAPRSRSRTRPTYP